VSTFVDSSVWFAAACKRDRNNELAKSILLSVDRCTLTDHVLVQTWQLIKAQFGTDLANTFWERLRETGAIVEPVTASDLETARQMSEAYPGEELSLVDRTSFTVMQRCGITRAATFSPSFEIFRYGPRKKTLQILRAGHSAAFVAIKDAILRRKPVRLNYRRRDLTACPYIVGHTVQEERAFVLVVDGIGRPSRAERGKWMCLRLASVKDIEVLDQPWTEQPYPGRIQRCVDSVHLDAARIGTAKCTAATARVSSKKSPQS
jgi:predicted nucleic acid-binding protein